MLHIRQVLEVVWAVSAANLERTDHLDHWLV